MNCHKSNGVEKDCMKLLTEGSGSAKLLSHRSISHSRERLVPDLADDAPDTSTPGQLCCYKGESYFAQEDELDSRDKHISGIDFRSNSNFFAASTTRKEVFIFKLKHESDPSNLMPIGQHRLHSRPVSLAWNRNSNVITLGDHEGQLTQIDGHTGHILVERDSDNGKPIWCIAKHKDPTIDTLVAAAEDGSVNLWSNDLSSSIKIKDPMVSAVPACTVAFSTQNMHELSVGFSNSEVHVMDLRYLERPVAMLPISKGRPVAHVEYLNSGSIACSSLGSEIHLWHRSSVDYMKYACKSIKMWSGHLQERCFTGLSVNEKDFIASGSEDGRIFIYNEESKNPLVVYPSVSTTKVASVKWVPAENDCSSSSNTLLMTSENCIQRCSVYQRGELV